ICIREIIISGQIKNYQGSVKINNQDEKTLSYDAIREALIYVDQIPYLFNGTIRYNLELGEHFSDQEIFDALRKADLLDYVKELPAGLNTKVGENGTKMSGGQKQRLALARGLLRNRKLFLLDESTSSLDKKSALNVENIFLSQPDITVIFVSHQLHDENKQKFDRIIKI
ncbi:MAG: ATP-binding cassette domain-containing protein, partial [Lactobacillus sp.]|nr:ATP-binding cassette domain-containing protein [Lactobacillus sp.]